MGIFFRECVCILVHVDPVAENINDAMAAVIRGLRGKKDWTQDRLADKSGINITTLKRLLKGQRDINVTQLAMLADAFGTTSELMMRDAIEEAISMSETGTTAIVTEVDFEDRYVRGMQDIAAHGRDDESDQDEQFD